MTPGRRLSGGTRPQADNTMGAAHQSASHGITFNTEFPGPSELGDGRKRKALDVGTSEPSQGLLHTSQYIATHDQTGQCLQPIAAASGTVPEFSTTTTTQKRQRLRTTSSSLGSSQSATAATVTTAGGPAPAHPLHPAATHQAVPQGPTEVSEHRATTPTPTPGNPPTSACDRSEGRISGRAGGGVGPVPGGHPWWPAMVQRPTAADKKKTGWRRGQVYVVYCGTKEVQALSRKYVQRWDERHTSASTRSDLNHAVQQAVRDVSEGARI
ncbi:hypothetical protein ABBQ32_007952 [Trebouxia sp. C0010 RCD-2024]